MPNELFGSVGFALSADPAASENARTEINHEGAEEASRSLSVWGVSNSVPEEHFVMLSAFRGSYFLIQMSSSLRFNSS